MLTKKINNLVFLAFLASVSFLVSTTVVLAKGSNYGAGGCGIGSKAFKENSVGSQIGASITNGLLTHTWSITSGTSGCEPDVASHIEKEQIKFVVTNYNSLRQEMATGKGEKLEAFIGLMGCSSVSSSFSQMTQKKHSELFEIKREEADKFVKIIKNNIQIDNNLAKSCHIKA